MIVCDRLVFIHLHKSGGTFVNQLLLQCEPSARQLGYHLPYRELPAEFHALPVLGTVRNPWIYYLSWYAFQSGQARPNALFRICSDDRALGFADTVRNLAGLGSDPTRFAALRAALPDRFAGAGLNVTKSCLDELQGRTIGFYTFLYERLYRGAAALTIVPAEHLRSGLSTALTRLAMLPNARAELFLQEVPRLNVSRHGPYREYYDADLASMIGQADAPVIEKHGYRF